MEQTEIGRMVPYAVTHLVAYARVLTGNDHDALDLTQETALRALEHCDKIRSGGKLLGWMRAVMRNLFYERMRKVREVSLDALPVDLPEEYVSQYSDREGYEPDWSLQEDYDYLARFVQRLTPKLQEFLSAVIEEKGDREAICARLSITPDMFRMYLARMKKDLIALGANRVMMPDFGQQPWYICLPKNHVLLGCYRRISQACADLAEGPPTTEEQEGVALLYGCLTTLFVIHDKTPQSHD